ncbi:MAG: ammonium transporter [Bradymonadia bacterium]
MISDPLFHLLWVVLCAALTLLMQGGFCCLESGLSRSKNSINVAMKNMADLCVATVVFWLVGFGLMFGESAGGFIGTGGMGLENSSEAATYAFFLFQIVFCGTATTIISGAVAERTRFSSYLIISVLVSAFIYPISGHWAWADGGWLKTSGFVDFAGSTVVHTVGGMVALAAAIIIGPRIGRFDRDEPIQGHNLPMAALGVLLLWFGWFGFNGGSDLHFSERVPEVLINTTLAAAAGGTLSILLSWRAHGRPEVPEVFNGVIGGLVAITANCHAVSGPEALAIGMIGAAVCHGATALLVRLEIDDVIGAFPAHGAAGIWGSLAVGIFGDLDALGTGLSRGGQIWVQAQGVLACGAWAFCVSYAVMWTVNRRWPLRVSRADELIGLNISEHGASTAILELLTQMQHHKQSGQFSAPVYEEPHTVAGQFASQYNEVIVRVHQEIEAREQATQHARAAERHYRNFFDHAISGIMKIAPEGHLLDANDALAQMLGDTSPQACMERIEHVASDLFENEESWHALVKQLVGNEVVQGYEFMARTLKLGTRRCRLNARIVRSAEGQLAWIEGAVEDVTAEHDVAEARLAMKQAEAASAAKSEMLAVMSHEVRTPLNGVMGTLNLLEHSGLDAQQHGYVKVCQSSAQSLSDLLGDLMDYSKLEAGHLELAPAPFELIDTIEGLAARFTARADEKQLKLHTHIGGNLPERVIGDVQRLSQILAHLVDNAVKFTEQGSITLKAELLSATQNNSMIRFEVRDTGIGIDADHEAWLFESFCQVETGDARRFDGAGLGLALCRKLAQLMRGQLGVDSVPGQGSVFWLRVPLGQVDPTATDAPVTFDGRHILIADASGVSRQLLSMQLESWGLDTTTAPDVERAFAALEAASGEMKPVSCMVVDMDLVGGGLTLASKVHDDPRFAHVPIILLAPADYTLNPKIRSRHGLFALLNKPVPLAQLRSRIEQSLRQPAPLPDGEHLTATMTDLPVFDAQTTRTRGDLSILLVEDNAVNRVVAREMLIRAGFNCHLAKHGREALDVYAEQPIDLIVMDCQMPEMDGFEATGRIRSSEPEGQHVPIVALTANTVAGDKDRCLAAGMDEHLTKPINPDKLIATLDRLLGLPQRPPVSKDTIPTMELLKQLNTLPPV